MMPPGDVDLLKREVPRSPLTRQLVLEGTEPLYDNQIPKIP